MRGVSRPTSAGASAQVHRRHSVPGAQSINGQPSSRRLSAPEVLLTEEQRRQFQDAAEARQRDHETLIELVRLSDWTTTVPATQTPQTSQTETYTALDEAESQAGTAQGRASMSEWLKWTAALVAARGIQGGIGTFMGRLAQAGVQMAAGEPEDASEIADSALVAGAVLNIAIGCSEAARAGLHVWRATAQPEVYARALRGLRTEPTREAVSQGSLSVMASAGTPAISASRLRRVASCVAAGCAVFAASAHTGVTALAHVGSDSPSKVAAYKAVWTSNGNAAYAFVRESFNAAVDGLGVISHRAPLTTPGAAACTGQYMASSLAQRATRAALETDVAKDGGAALDMRWPLVSSAFETVDVAAVATAARMASPEQPVSFFRGAWSEHAQDPQPYVPPSLPETLDRILQRGASRHLVAQVCQVIPAELAEYLFPKDSSATAACLWAGAGFQSATHLREMLWQAETAAIAARAASRLEQRDSDVEDPIPGPNPSEGEMRITPTLVGTQSSIIERDISNIV